MVCCNVVVLLIWFAQMPSVYFAFVIVVVIVIEVTRLAHVAASYRLVLLLL